jgi:hypothetical protein
VSASTIVIELDVIPRGELYLDRENIDELVARRTSPVAYGDAASGLDRP